MSWRRLVASLVWMGSHNFWFRLIGWGGCLAEGVRAAQGRFSRGPPETAAPQHLFDLDQIFFRGRKIRGGESSSILLIVGELPRKNRPTQTVSSSLYFEVRNAQYRALQVLYSFNINMNIFYSA